MNVKSSLGLFRYILCLLIPFMNQTIQQYTRYQSPVTTNMVFSHLSPPMLKNPRFPLVMHIPGIWVDYYAMDIDRDENIVIAGGSGVDKYFLYQDKNGVIRWNV